MADKLRVGIVGAGGIAQGAHLPAVKKVERAEPIALCDLDSNKAERVARENNIPYFFQDYQDMFEKVEMDAVIICLPTYLHLPATKMALEAELHVLCEKPLAMNALEALEMVELARRAKKILMVALNERFQSYSQVLKKLIENQELGDIYYAKMGWLRRQGVPGGWFSEKEKAGGGPLIDLGVHLLDLAWWLMGNPKPMSVIGSTNMAHPASYISDSDILDNENKPLANNLDSSRNVSDREMPKAWGVEDLAVALVKFERGQTLFLETSWTLHCRDEIMYGEIFGTQGGARIGPVEFCKMISKPASMEIYKNMQGIPVNITPVLEDVNSYDAEVKHFIDCIIQGREPTTPAEQAIEVMRIIDAIYKSAQTGQMVRIGNGRGRPDSFRCR
ncbi:hypothetical protein HKBW3S03_00415 [Candidatus Hakubella thermalkaliphila]|uniref:Gfo/Idh/MocA family oxidoreductase n=1 Tax=Candidatus Hakubella thermalkaliphila TaxID=2754717 RepID=A0A6V8PA20_9ACTN|nr:Gfo/Idh/MocA family oxidoreductase [Candidatus Hakubella thermalkaliphila]GFP18910.1 hypothetical protein HKBW3S03_00415 [Candidatus Hakubella thermalkaliphila]GFP23633.1 hypothetical protein HKBW3S09_01098 [Candidatus Hakubella thermalkaliphila]GFP29117.1 hypothetical protein HKBW3S34_00036 [Candidatus Hakubella thermalkaliphila]GFP36832.1 hypothetical protein HKBW3S44_00513 [Candidatus Hakubella thermalkaliphila]GFP38382.1 hypothetical protein HKBW3S47_00083 [Candidatus Hakubella thermalk